MIKYTMQYFMPTMKVEFTIVNYLQILEVKGNLSHLLPLSDKVKCIFKRNRDSKLTKKRFVEAVLHFCVIRSSGVCSTYKSPNFCLHYIIAHTRIVSTTKCHFKYKSIFCSSKMHCDYFCVIL